MGVNWNWKWKKDQSLYGSKACLQNTDFDSKKEANKAIEAYFEQKECDQCGSKKVNGYNIKVEITKVNLYHDVKKKRFFGGEKTVEEFWKTVFRVGSIVFPSAWLLSSGGHFKCKKCGHRMGSPGFFGQWASNYANLRQVEKYNIYQGMTTTKSSFDDAVLGIPHKFIISFQYFFQATTSKECIAITG